MGSDDELTLEEESELHRLAYEAGDKVALLWMMRHCHYMHWPVPEWATALELSQPCIGLPRLLSSRCRPSSLSLQRSDCHSGDPTRRTHRRLQR